MMSSNRVYLLHPSSKQIPEITDWISEVKQVICTEADWVDWDLYCIEYNSQNGFDVQPLFVRVKNKPGPIVLFDCVKKSSLAEIREKLGIYAVVLVRSMSDPTELWSTLDEARRRHIDGEPLLPRKFVVSVLIVRKLRNGHYWGGNAKGYLWHFDIAKGRGVDVKFADITDEVVNDLLLNKILIHKTSQGRKKYALNPEAKPEIHAIADDAEFKNIDLRKRLWRDPRQEPASALHIRRTAGAFTLRSGDEKAHRFYSASAAIEHALGYADLGRYQACVIFDDGGESVEVFDNRRLLVQFFEAFI